jgi:hypothetical protein
MAFTEEVPLPWAHGGIAFGNGFDGSRFEGNGLCAGNPNKNQDRYFRIGYCFQPECEHKFRSSRTLRRIAPMANQTEETAVALEYYKALRAEIVSRFQMRDQVMLGYLAATGTLLGFVFTKENSSHLLPYLLVLFPFLSLGALSMVAQHQDQITAYYEYFCTELRSSLSKNEQTVAMFYLSKAAQEHTRHILAMLFISQTIIMCGPRYSLCA